MYDRVLIIEGEPDLRKNLTSALTEAAFKVSGVANYFEALWELGEFKPNLIILNEKLPLLDGWESCYQLHRTCGIPVIMIGEDSGEEVGARTLEAGADFYLRVPFSHLELLARIVTILRRYKKDEVTH